MVPESRWALSVNLGFLNLDRVPAARTVEDEDLVHAGCSIRGATMRTEDLSANSWRRENPARRPFPDAGIKGARVCRGRVEMGDRFLEPRQDFGHRVDGLFRQIAVDLVSQAQLNAAIPEPADFDVNLAVVDFLLRPNPSLTILRPPRLSNLLA